MRGSRSQANNTGRHAASTTITRFLIIDGFLPGSCPEIKTSSGSEREKILVNGEREREEREGEGEERRGR